MAKIIKLESKRIISAKEAAPKTKTGEFESPEHYQKLIKENPLDKKAYNRLMILYRKLREYKQELHLINTAIRSFEAFNRSNKKKTDKKIQTISHKLSRSLGLVDHRGKATYDGEPVAGWKKRREVVLKKLGK